VRFVDFDPHEAEFEDLGDDRGVDLAVALHLRHQGADFLVGKGGDSVAKQELVFGERRKWGGHGSVAVEWTRPGRFDAAIGPR
jgi:hypothetical protein